MFRHKGKGRTYLHNLKLASILSSVAGMVGIIGVLALNTLTTNVTGHFAYFSEQLFLHNFSLAITFLIYIIFFLLGSFVSSFLIDLTSRFKPHYSYKGPLITEIVLLSSICFLGNKFLFHLNHPMPTACILLFSMGLQNALVTSVSQSIVRTTHLTGLFTDLGIELSHLFFFRTKNMQIKLRKNIFLKTMIIIGYFTGGIIGGFCYKNIGINTLILPITLLIFALWYDSIRLQYFHIKRKMKNKNTNNKQSN